MSLSFLLLPLLPLLVTLCSSGALAAESNVVRIANASKFISFANDVNQGTNYDGTTVLLVSDLSFSGMAVEPIGKTSTINFRGTFDGQGHVISDLKNEFNVTVHGIVWLFDWINHQKCCPRFFLFDNKFIQQR